MCLYAEVPECCLNFTRVSCCSLVTSGTTDYISVAGMDIILVLTSCFFQVRMLLKSSLEKIIIAKLVSLHCYDIGLEFRSYFFCNQIV